VTLFVGDIFILEGGAVYLGHVWPYGTICFHALCFHLLRARSAVPLRGLQHQGLRGQLHELGRRRTPGNDELRPRPGSFTTNGR